MDWIQIAQDWFRWPDLVNTVMNILYTVRPAEELSVSLEKLIVAQVANKFPALYRASKFITVLARARRVTIKCIVPYKTRYVETETALHWSNIRCTNK